MATALSDSPRKVKFTDKELRECLKDGLSQAAISRRFGCSQPAVSQRVKALGLTTASAAVAPRESQRFVRRQIDVMEQLSLNLGRANLLQDACDRWLRDPQDPDRYDVGPRSEEVDVIYRVEVESGDRLIVQNRKKKLSELLALLAGEIDEEGGRIIGVDKGEYKHADPRELILRTQQETRSTAALVMEAVQKLMDAQTMEAWRKAVIEEIAKESPDCARRIAERVQRSIVLYAAFGGPGVLAAGDGNN